MKITKRYWFLIWCIAVVFSTAMLMLTHMDLHIDVEEGTLDGKQEMKKYSVVFTACTKNNEKYIGRSLDIINALGKLFKNYSLVVYENDSVDKTRYTLIQRQQQNYYYIFEDRYVHKNKFTHRLSHCRTLTLKKALELHPDFIIVIDPDNVIKSAIILDTIHNAFNYDTTNWHAMTANQIDTYYDTYALVTDVFDYESTISEPRSKTPLPFFVKHHYYRFVNIMHRSNHGLTKVLSAFGGVGIYNASMAAICKDAYKVEWTDEIVRSEHVGFNFCVKKVFINNAMMTGYELDRIN